MRFRARQLTKQYYLYLNQTLPTRSGSWILIIPSPIIPSPHLLSAYLLPLRTRHDLWLSTLHSFHIVDETYYSEGSVSIAYYLG